MKNIIVIGFMSIECLFANYITEAVQVSSQCQNSISQSPKTVMQKYCSAVYNHSIRLNSFSSYRSFERMETLRKIQKISKNIDGDNGIERAVHQELSLNQSYLKSIWWPHNKLNYLDVELKNGNLFLLFNKKNNSLIQYDMKKISRINSKKGKAVLICTSKNICENIQGNILKVKQGLVYNKIRVLTNQGTFEQAFKSTKISNLAGLAYEISSQLYNKQAPSLSTLSIQTIFPRIPQSTSHKVIINSNETVH